MTPERRAKQKPLGDSPRSLTAKLIDRFLKTNQTTTALLEDIPRSLTGKLINRFLKTNQTTTLRLGDIPGSPSSIQSIVRSAGVSPTAKLIDRLLKTHQTTTASLGDIPGSPSQPLRSSTAQECPPPQTPFVRLFPNSLVARNASWMLAGQLFVLLAKRPIS